MVVYQHLCGTHILPLQTAMVVSLFLVSKKTKMVVGELPVSRMHLSFGRIYGANASAVIYSIAETAKANNLKPYEYFEHLLSEIPKHMEDNDLAFLEDLLPWSPELPEHIRKNK